MQESRRCETLRQQLKHVLFSKLKGGGVTHVWIMYVWIRGCGSAMLLLVTDGPNSNVGAEKMEGWWWWWGGKHCSTHTLMWVHDESLLPDPHLFLEAGYTGTIANHFALSLSKVARLN